MSNAYAERFRILPVAVTRDDADRRDRRAVRARRGPTSSSRSCKLDVELVFANPVDIRRYLGEFYNLARSMKKAPGERARARSRSRATSSSWSSSASAARSTPTTSHVVHIVDWLWQYAFEQRASDIHIEPRRDVGHGALPHRRRAAPGLRDPDAGADRDDLAHQAARADGDRREAPAAGRPHQDGRARRQGGRAAHLDDAHRVRREARDAHLHARGAGARLHRAGLHGRRPRALGADDRASRTASSSSPAPPARARRRRSTRR